MTPVYWLADAFKRISDTIHPVYIFGAVCGSLGILGIVDVLRGSGL